MIDESKRKKKQKNWPDGEKFLLRTTCEANMKKNWRNKTQQNCKYHFVLISVYNMFIIHLKSIKRYTV